MKQATLVISPEPWDAHPVSKHHYARVLAESGRTVLFLEPPTQSGTGIEVHSVSDVPGLRVLRGPRVAPGLRFMPAVVRNWLEARWLARVEALTDTAISTIWLFENSRFFDLRFAGDRLKIYHQVDLNQNYNPMTAARTADVCLCTTDIIRDQLIGTRPHVHKVHHGVPLADSSSSDGESAGLLHGDGPHAVYIGNLDMAYIDVDAIVRLVESHPEVMFHFVGGFRADNALRSRCAVAANTRWLGKRPFQEIPAFLRQADVLLVAYTQERQRDQASPHKFMEYLLSGKTIVCSYTDEYRDKAQLVEMAQPDETIDGIFARVVSDLDTYNAPLRMAERRAFALDHTYERQLKRIEDIVREATGRTI